MALTKLTKDMEIIAKLDDEPNDVGGLSAVQLKEKFDEAGQAVKDYINETLLPELAAATAAAALGATLDGKDVTVQEALDVLKTLGMKQGNVPVAGDSGAILRKASDETFDLKWSPMVTRFEFTTGDWVQDPENPGRYTITVPAGVHQRYAPNFGCLLRHKVGQVYQSGTWAALGARSWLDAATGAVVLESGEAYDGCAMFFDEGA